LLSFDVLDRFVAATATIVFADKMTISEHDLIGIQVHEAPWKQSSCVCAGCVTRGLYPQVCLTFTHFGHTLSYYASREVLCPIVIVAIINNTITNINPGSCWSEFQRCSKIVTDKLG
jgi:hypothetical protein